MNFGRSLSEAGQMGDKQHWIVTAGLISGYIILTILGIAATAAVYRHGFHWRYVTAR